MPDSPGRMSLPAAVAIGIGGMVGAGIFSVLGVAAQSAGNGLWISFLIGAVAAGLSTYSYAKLGAAFPSAGGAVRFLNVGFGPGLLAGGINVFMWVGYILALALYAHAFGAYAATFAPAVPKEVLAIGAIVLFTGVNLLGAGSVGKWELVIVVAKVAILVLFAAGGLFSMDIARLSPSETPALPALIAGAGIIFMGYEGFGLVANSAGSMGDPKRMLPRALYTSVAIVAVLYLAVSVAVLGNLSVAQMAASKDYALAEAARPFLGEFGFRLVAVAAVLSTASAINATLFGSANVAFLIARDGELPAGLSRPVRGGSVGTLLTGGLAIVFIALIDLSGIAMMGSLAFLLIYTAVNAGHLRVTSQTGGRPAVIIAAIVACLIIFAFLAQYTYRQQPAAVAAMAALLALSFAGELVFRRFRASARS